MTPEKAARLTVKACLTILAIALFFAFFSAVDWLLGLGDPLWYKSSCAIFVGLLVAHEWFRAVDE